MFHNVILAVVGEFQRAQAEKERERILDKKMRDTLPAEEYVEWLRRKERNEELRLKKEMNDDLCKAVESTSFWRFGRSDRV